MTLPASSFLSIDRVNEMGDIRQGNRQIIGRLAPRGEPRPQLLVPGRGEVTRQLIRCFDSLDLVIVNAQNIRGRHLANSIRYFLAEVSAEVPILIVAASPADLTAVGATDPPSKAPMMLWAKRSPERFEVRSVSRDRPIVERQFCFAIGGLAERSVILGRLVSQAERTWWATRQSMSLDVPREAVAFGNLYADMLSRSLDGELELLQEAKRLIAQEAGNVKIREERRTALIQSVAHDSKARTLLIIVRSESAAEEFKHALADYLGITTSDLAALGIEIVSVFGPMPTTTYDACVAAGYFGTGTIDMLFTSGGLTAAIVVDPIEARVALWDIERRFCGVPNLPETVIAALRAFASTLETHASPSSVPVSLSMLLGEGSGAGIVSMSTAIFAAKATYVCLCFADGSTQQIAANARFEVVGRKRLQLQTIAAKDLHMGDQVVLLNDEERAAFSETLLRVMDGGRLKLDRQRRSNWISTLRAVLSVCSVSASDIRKRMESDGLSIDLSTIRTWLPPNSSEECGVPDRENVFLAFARALEIAIPEETLIDWFAGIDKLRNSHRRIGRELVRAIRGAYFGRLDPLTVAKMEREWGVEAKTLLEAARVAIVDEVIPLVQ